MDTTQHAYAAIISITRYESAVYVLSFEPYHPAPATAATCTRLNATCLRRRGGWRQVRRGHSWSSRGRG